MNFWDGIKSDFFRFGMKPRLCTEGNILCEILVGCEFDLSSANRLGTEIMIWHVDASVMLLRPLVW